MSYFSQYEPPYERSFDELQAALDQAYNRPDPRRGLGVNSFQAGLYSSLSSFAANREHEKELAALQEGDEQRAAYHRMRAEAEERLAADYQPRVPEASSVGSVSDAMSWAGAAAGQGVASFAKPLAGAGLGAVAGGLIGAAIPVPGAAALGAKIGGALGGAYPAFEMERNETIGEALNDEEIRQKAEWDRIRDVAFNKGVVAGALEFGPQAAVARLALRPLAKGAQGLTNIATREVLPTMLGEAATEGMQSVVGQAAQKELKDQSWRDYDWTQVLNEAAAGAVGGGVMAAPGAAVRGLAQAYQNAGGNEAMRERVGSLLGGQQEAEQQAAPVGEQSATTEEAPPVEEPDFRTNAAGETEDLRATQAEPEAAAQSEQPAAETAAETGNEAATAAVDEGMAAEEEVKPNAEEVRKFRRQAKDDALLDEVFEEEEQGTRNSIGAKTASSPYWLDKDGKELKGITKAVGMRRSLQKNFTNLDESNSNFVVVDTAADAVRMFPNDPHARQIAANPNAGWRGFTTTQNGQPKVVLIGENIPQGEELATFLHEAGVHVGMRNSFGAEAITGIANEIRNIAQGAEGIEQGLAARAIEQATGTDFVDEETIAYFVEYALTAKDENGKNLYQSRVMREKNNPIQRILNAIIAYVKRFLESIGLKSKKALSAQELIDTVYGLAQKGANTMAEQAQETRVEQQTQSRSVDTNIDNIKLLNEATRLGNETAATSALSEEEVADLFAAEGRKLAERIVSNPDFSPEMIAAAQTFLENGADDVFAEQVQQLLLSEIDKLEAKRIYKEFGYGETSFSRELGVSDEVFLDIEQESESVLLFLAADKDRLTRAEYHDSEVKEQDLHKVNPNDVFNESQIAVIKVLLAVSIKNYNANNEELTKLARFVDGNFHQDSVWLLKKIDSYFKKHKKLFETLRTKDATYNLSFIQDTIIDDHKSRVWHLAYRVIPKFISEENLFKINKKASDAGHKAQSEARKNGVDNDDALKNIYDRAYDKVRYNEYKKALTLMQEWIKQDLDKEKTDTLKEQRDVKLPFAEADKAELKQNVLSGIKLLGLMSEWKKQKERSAAEKNKNVPSKLKTKPAKIPSIDNALKTPQRFRAFLDEILDLDCWDNGVITTTRKATYNSIEDIVRLNQDEHTLVKTERNGHPILGKNGERVAYVFKQKESVAQATIKKNDKGEKEVELRESIHRKDTGGIDIRYAGESYYIYDKEGDPVWDKKSLKIIRVGDTYEETIPADVGFNNDVWARGYFRKLLERYRDMTFTQTDKETYIVKKARALFDLDRLSDITDADFQSLQQVSGLLEEYDILPSDQYSSGERPTRIRSKNTGVDSVAGRITDDWHIGRQRIYDIFLLSLENIKTLLAWKSLDGIERNARQQATLDRLNETAANQERELEAKLKEEEEVSETGEAPVEEEIDTEEQPDLTNMEGDRKELDFTQDGVGEMAKAENDYGSGLHTLGFKQQFSLAPNLFHADLFATTHGLYGEDIQPEGTVYDDKAYDIIHFNEATRLNAEQRKKTKNENAITWMKELALSRDDTATMAKIKEIKSDYLKQGYDTAEVDLLTGSIMWLCNEYTNVQPAYIIKTPDMLQEAISRVTPYWARAYIAKNSSSKDPETMLKVAEVKALLDRAWVEEDLYNNRVTDPQAALKLAYDYMANDDSYFMLAINETSPASLFNFGVRDLHKIVTNNTLEEYLRNYSTMPEFKRKMIEQNAVHATFVENARKLRSTNEIAYETIGFDNETILRQARRLNNSRMRQYAERDMQSPSDTGSLTAYLEGLGTIMTSWDKSTRRVGHLITVPMLQRAGVPELYQRPFLLFQNEGDAQAIEDTKDKYLQSFRYSLVYEESTGARAPIGVKTNNGVIYFKDIESFGENTVEREILTKVSAVLTPQLTDLRDAGFLPSEAQALIKEMPFSTSTIPKYIQLTKEDDDFYGLSAIEALAKQVGERDEFWKRHGFKIGAGQVDPTTDRAAVEDIVNVFDQAIKTEAHKPSLAKVRADIPIKDSMPKSRKMALTAEQKKALDTPVVTMRFELSPLSVNNESAIKKLTERYFDKEENRGIDPYSEENRAKARKWAEKELKGLNELFKGEYDTGRRITENNKTVPVVESVFHTEGGRKHLSAKYRELFGGKDGELPLQFIKQSMFADPINTFDTLFNSRFRSIIDRAVQHGYIDDENNKLLSLVKEMLEFKKVKTNTGEDSYINGKLQYEITPIKVFPRYNEGKNEKGETAYFMTIDFPAKKLEIYKQILEEVAANYQTNYGYKKKSSLMQMDEFEKEREAATRKYYEEGGIVANYDMWMDEFEGKFFTSESKELAKARYNTFEQLDSRYKAFLNEKIKEKVIADSPGYKEYVNTERGELDTTEPWDDPYIDQETNKFNFKKFFFEDFSRREISDFFDEVMLEFTEENPDVKLKKIVKEDLIGLAPNPGIFEHEIIRPAFEMMAAIRMNNNPRTSRKENIYGEAPKYVDENGNLTERDVEGARQTAWGAEEDGVLSDFKPYRGIKGYNSGAQIATDAKSGQKVDTSSFDVTQAELDRRNTEQEKSERDEFERFQDIVNPFRNYREDRGRMKKPKLEKDNIEEELLDTDYVKKAPWAQDMPQEYWDRVDAVMPPANLKTKKQVKFVKRAAYLKFLANEAATDDAATKELLNEKDKEGRVTFHFIGRGIEETLLGQKKKAQTRQWVKDKKGDYTFHYNSDTQTFDFIGGDKFHSKPADVTFWQPKGILQRIAEVDGNTTAAALFNALRDKGLIIKTTDGFKVQLTKELVNKWLDADHEANEISLNDFGDALIQGSFNEPDFGRYFSELSSLEGEASRNITWDDVVVDEAKRAEFMRVQMGKPMPAIELSGAKTKTEPLMIYLNGEWRDARPSTIFDTFKQDIILQDDPINGEGDKHAYMSIEHAWWTLKSGKFDEFAYKDFLNDRNNRRSTYKVNEAIASQLLTAIIKQSILNDDGAIHAVIDANYFKDVELRFDKKTPYEEKQKDSVKIKNEMTQTGLQFSKLLPDATRLAMFQIQDLVDKKGVDFEKVKGRGREDTKAMPEKLTYDEASNAITQFQYSLKPNDTVRIRLGSSFDRNDLIIKLTEIIRPAFKDEPEWLLATGVFERATGGDKDQEKIVLATGDLNIIANDFQKIAEGFGLELGENPTYEQKRGLMKFVTIAPDVINNYLPEIEEKTAPSDEKIIPPSEKIWQSIERLQEKESVSTPVPSPKTPVKNPKREIILDTETTGTRLENGARVIELAGIELIDGKPTGKEYHKFFRQNVEIEKAAERVHGITKEKLNEIGVELTTDEANKFLEFVGKGANIVAHNSSFDINFINNELKQLGLPGLENYAGKFTNTIDLAREKLENQSLSLSNLIENFKINSDKFIKEGDETSHGALLDSKLLTEVYKKLKESPDSPKVAAAKKESISLDDNFEQLLARGKKSIPSDGIIELNINGVKFRDNILNKIYEKPAGRIRYYSYKHKDGVMKLNAADIESLFSAAEEYYRTNADVITNGDKKREVIFALSTLIRVMPKPSHFTTTSDNVAQSKQEAVNYLNKVLGDSVEVAFHENTWGETKSQVGSFTEKDGKNLISLALSGNVLSTAHHEAAHALMSTLRKDAPQHYEKLLDYSAKYKDEIIDILTKHGAGKAVESATKDAEEMAAYAYQLAMAGLLPTNALSKRVVGKLGRMWLRVAGLFNDAMRRKANESADLLEAENNLHLIYKRFNEGGLAHSKDAFYRQLDADLAPKRRWERWNKAAAAFGKFFDNILAASDTVLRRSDIPELEEIADMFYVDVGEHDMSSMHSKGEKGGALSRYRQLHRIWTNRYHNLTKEYAKEEKAAIRKALLNKDRNMLKDERLRKGYDAYREFFDGVFNEFNEMGVENRVKDSFTGKRVWRKFDYANDYMPFLWDRDAVRNNRIEFTNLLTEEVKAAVEVGRLKIPTIDKNAAKLEYPERSYAESIVSEILGENRDDHADSAFWVDKGTFKQNAERYLDFVEDRAKFDKFLSGDIDDMVFQYSMRTSKNAVFQQVFGKDLEKLNALLAKARESVAKKYNLSGKELDERMAHYEHAIHSMMGMLGQDMSPQLRTLNSYGAMYQNVRLLAMVLFSSIQDIAGLRMHGGTLKDQWDGLVRGLKSGVKVALNKDDRDKWMQRAEEFGIVPALSNPSIIQELAGTQDIEGKAGAFNRGFFRYILMEGWTRGTRAQAAIIAERKILEWKEKGVDRANKGDVLTFERCFGNMDPKDIKTDGVYLENNEANRIALGRLVDDMVMNPTEANKPLWANDPRFILFAQLKTFSYTIHRVLLRGIIEQIRQGNIAPAVSSFAGLIPTALAGYLVKEAILSAVTGDDDDDWKWKWDSMMPYVINRSGAFGIPQMFWEDKSDPANLFGPTIGQIQDIASIPIRGQFGTNWSHTPEREALSAMPAGTVLKRFYDAA